MVESMVITLREGIEAALVVGIILAYLRKTGRYALNRFVYTGVILAAAASLGMAAMFQVLSIDPENEVMEGAMLGIAGLFVGSMVVWMWRTAQNIRLHTEQKLATIVGEGEARSARIGQGVGLLVFTFLMVFREGVETVLFLAAATLGEMNVLSLLGGALGLGLAGLFAVFFVRGSLRIDLPRFFGVTSVVLLLLAVKLIAGSLHEFAEVGIVPMSSEVMSILGYFVREESSTVIVTLLLVLPLALVLWETGKKPDTTESPSTGVTAAERRKWRAAVRQEALWRMALIGATVVIVLAMASTVFAGPKYVDPEPVPVSAVGGSVHIPVTSLEEGRLHKFSLESGGAVLRFLAARLHDGTIATGMDACQICGAAGYMQEGENAICKNCNAPIAMPTLSYGGGCNPLALKSKVDGSDLVIAVSDLEGARSYFVR